eukprot:COSAG04_NODE_15513_length_530_cov_0.568445_2_plen_22_part_01
MKVRLHARLAAEARVKEEEEEQ